MDAPLQRADAIMPAESLELTLESTSPQPPVREAIREGAQRSPSHDVMRSDPRDGFTAAAPPPQLSDEQVETLVHTIVSREVPGRPRPKLWFSACKAGLIGAFIAGLVGAVIIWEARSNSPTFASGPAPQAVVLVEIPQLIIMGFMLGALWGCMRYWDRQGKS